MDHATFSCIGAWGIYDNKVVCIAYFLNRYFYQYDLVNSSTYVLETNTNDIEKRVTEGSSYPVSNPPFLMNGVDLRKMSFRYSRIVPITIRNIIKDHSIMDPTTKIHYITKLLETGVPFFNEIVHSSGLSSYSACMEHHGRWVSSRDSKYISIDQIKNQPDYIQGSENYMFYIFLDTDPNDEKCPWVRIDINLLARKYKLYQETPEDYQQWSELRKRPLKFLCYTTIDNIISNFEMCLDTNKKSVVGKSMDIEISFDKLYQHLYNCHKRIKNHHKKTD